MAAEILAASDRRDSLSLWDRKDKKEKNVSLPINVRIEVSKKTDRHYNRLLVQFLKKVENHWEHPFLWSGFMKAKIKFRFH